MLPPKQDTKPQAICKNRTSSGPAICKYAVCDMRLAKSRRFCKFRSQQNICMLINIRMDW